jgi:hypothetical protein
MGLGMVSTDSWVLTAADSWHASSLQAVWALGNIAGDSPKCRDYVLGFNAMAPLLDQLVETSKITMLRNATWTLSNFCRGKPSPPFHIVGDCLHEDDFSAWIFEWCIR